jgi:hypothetical protein
MTQLKYTLTPQPQRIIMEDRPHDSPRLATSIIAVGYHLQTSRHDSEGTIGNITLYMCCQSRAIHFGENTKVSIKALTAWARETLHPSFLSLKANNLFEVIFEIPEGKIHVWTQAELSCEMAFSFFSCWHPHFDSEAPHAMDRLDHPDLGTICGSMPSVTGRNIPQDQGVKLKGYYPYFGVQPFKFPSKYFATLQKGRGNFL